MSGRRPGAGRRSLVAARADAERRPGRCLHTVGRTSTAPAGKDPISLDPERDTPEVLRGYAEAHGVRPGWYFLTGKRDDIEQLRRKLGAYDPDPVVDADPKQHTGLVIVGDEPRGRWRAISVLSKPVRIEQAIERVRLPASQWPTGKAAVEAAPYEESEASQRRVGPPDLTDLPLRD